MPINLNTQKYETVGVTSMSELPSVVVSPGARNAKSKQCKIGN